MHQAFPSTRSRQRFWLRGSRGLCWLAGVLCLGMGLRQEWRSHVVRAAAADVHTPPLQDPDVACERCHSAVYQSYKRTAMARGSGMAVQGLIPGSFDHKPSGVNYRVFLRDGKPRMSFDRPGNSAAGALQGERELQYFVGSGKHGRTYLYDDEGGWFQLPVNYYTRRDAWDMAPSFGGATTMPAPLPVDANCIHCHATAIEVARPEARNHFPLRPFDQGGIGCSACHGDPARHLASGGREPILNPDKLTPAARDSACVQCHLEGNAVVYRPGRSLAQFRPGELLSDSAVYFVKSSQLDGGQRASSQYEALLRSACKRAAGDRLTCTTCHNPHSAPGPSERVAYFRARCLACHTSPAIALQHHPEQPDCAFCHMPSRATVDISHEQVTDHNIQRIPAQNRTLKPHEGEELAAVGDVAVGDRELGLAYAQMAEKGDRVAAKRALNLLRHAEQNGATDQQVHTTLGFLEQVSGNVAAARTEYLAALDEDAYDPAAMSNVAVLDAGAGDIAGATRLLEKLVKADPSQTRAGLNLAYIQCQLGQKPESYTLARRLQELNPDSPELRRFLDAGAMGTQTCR